MKDEIIELFKGGYPSPLLNGLKTANCGKHILFNNSYYEVMGKEISSHPYNIVSKYLITDNGGKIEFSCSINKDTGLYHFGIAYYKNKLDNSSFRYVNKIPKKYEHLKQELKNIHLKLFDGIWGK